MNATKIKAISVILVIFVLGLTIGWFGGRYTFQCKIKEMAAEGSPPLKLFFMQKMGRNLDLTEAQQEEIDPIVSKTEIKLHRLLQDSRIEFAGIMSNMTDQVKKHLTLAQQEKVDENFKRFRELWHLLPNHAEK